MPIKRYNEISTRGISVFDEEKSRNKENDAENYTDRKITKRVLGHVIQF